MPINRFDNEIYFNAEGSPVPANEASTSFYENGFFNHFFNLGGN